MRVEAKTIGRALRLVAALSFLFLAVMSTGAASDSDVQVALDVSKAGPRPVENLTQRSVLRDYKFAWSSLAQALESNSIGPLNGPFEGSASLWLQEKVEHQRSSDLKSVYANQAHRVEAVFYAPEGDVIELHDTAEYDLQISDGDKKIHSGHEVVHYVVLMTPASDRWVVRQLQAVPQF